MLIICKVRRAKERVGITHLMKIRTRRPYKRWTKVFLGIAIFISACIGLILIQNQNKENPVCAYNTKYTLKRETKSSQLDAVIIFIKSLYSRTKIKSVNKNIQENFPLLTLFTSWVDRKDKYVVQNRTLENWITFKPHVHPIIFTNDTKLAEQCHRKGWDALPLMHTTAGGIPVLRYMYINALRHFNSLFYGFANSDILFNEGLIKTLDTVRAFVELNQVPVLITGRRTNVDYKIPCNASDWMNITSVSKKGELANPLSADYFITTKDYPWEEMDEVIIGRSRVDNWVIQFSRMKNIIVIDSTPTILAMHQTTETGNHEGESKDNKYYNDNIVSKVRAYTINQNRGQTLCAEYFTECTSELVQLVKQSQNRVCDA